MSVAAETLRSIRIDYGPDSEWHDEDVIALLAEVERLRAELARQAEQITAIRALHKKWPPLEHPTNQDFCKYDSERWPCPTITALDGAS